MLKNLYLFVGRSGTGKSTIVQRAAKELGERQVVSNTTRPRRFAEESGYHFLTDQEFDHRGIMLAPTVFAGYRYGVTMSDLDAGSFFIVDPKGAVELKKTYHNRPVKVIGIHASTRELSDRMKARGDSTEAIRIRLLHDDQRYEQMLDICDIIVHNVDIDAAVRIVAGFVKASEGDEGEIENRPRQFVVDTPMGKLRACAKADFGKKPGDMMSQDCTDDFPGIYVDLVREGRDDELLACVEYESCDKKLQTCVYGDLLSDAPTHVEVYKKSKFSNWSQCPHQI